MFLRTAHLKIVYNFSFGDPISWISMEKYLYNSGVKNLVLYQILRTFFKRNWLMLQEKRISKNDGRNMGEILASGLARIKFLIANTFKKDLLKPSDLLIVNQGVELLKGRWRLSVEMPMHVSIYRRR